jgi:plastocyanin
MKSHRMIPLIAAALALSFPLTISTNNGGKHNDQDKNDAPQDAIVHFGDPVTLEGDGNHVLVPDDTTIRKGGTITFVVNGGGHGIAIYPVSKNTTREDITTQLCVHDPATNACDDATFANADHMIRDGQGNVVMATGTNPPFQRVDDPTDRLLATSTQVGNLPGVFLTGTTATTLATQLQYRFAKTGRYLAICMNRNHYLANWMFGFISVVGDDDK